MKISQAVFTKLGPVVDPWHTLFSEAGQISWPFYALNYGPQIASSSYMYLVF